jgi:hypothetical protein
MVDQADGNFIMLVVEANLDHQAFVKVHKDTGVILWETPEFNHYIEGGYGTFHWSDLSYGRFENVKTGNPLSGTKSFELNTITGELTEDVDHGGWACEANKGQSYTSKSRISVNDFGNKAWWFGRQTGGPATLQSIVEDVCARCGLLPADIDASALSGTTIPGYLVPRNMRGQAALDALMNFYLFDVVEVDDVLVFVPRGGSVVGTIDQQDLVAFDKDAETYSEIKLPVEELPSEVSILYMDPNLDYAHNTHRAKRILLPSPESPSLNKLDIRMPGVLEPDVAKAQAMVLLLANWEGRISRAFTANRSFIKFVPTDVMTMTLDDGRTVRIRLTNSEIRNNLEYELSSYQEDSSQYSFPATADGGSGHVPQEIPGGATGLTLVTIPSPLWKDTHSIARTASQYYYYMLPQVPGNLSVGVLYQSDDDTVYVQIGSSTTEPTWGYSLGGLPDVPFDEKWQIDYTNSLSVQLMNEGLTLSSVTLDQMVTGTTNAFALIDKDGRAELMKFQTVVAEADGTHTLTGLCRGRRGTDRFMDNHTGGDLFIMLDTDAGIALTDLADIGTVKYLKAAAVGTVIEDVIADPFTNPGNDLKPWAPVWIESDGALFGTDIDLTWVKRTRIGGQLRNFSGGDVPLNEDAELYDAEIWDGATLKRTYTDLTTPAVTYTSAEQTADSWSSPTEISVIVYQKSGQVGRGFPSHKTVIQV